MMAEQLLIRADGGVQIGTGHIMRMLALAQAWQAAGGTVTLVANDSLPAALIERLQNEGVKVHLLDIAPGSIDDAAKVAALAHELTAQAVVVDGYHFKAAYQKLLKEAGLRLLFVDDNGHAEYYYADFVLNQNIHADAAFYANREPYTQLLLGTKYTLLRREFWPWRGWQREIPAVARKLLVTMGGADPDNITGKALAALDSVEIDGLEVTVIVGSSNPHAAELEAIAAQSRHIVHVERNVNDMPSLLAWADMAVSAGGSTTWELAFMGVPTALIVLADNQVTIAKGMSEQGAALSLGWHENLTKHTITSVLCHLAYEVEQRRELSKRSGQLVDGEGSKRVVRSLLE